VRFLPSTGDYPEIRARWRRDVVAGATVGVVALPLALAFGITTGLGAAAGLATAIVAGLVAAAFGGSDVQVSGPTGAMTVVLVPIVERHGTDAVLVVGIMAGALLLVAAMARLGRVLAYVPWPVIEGFTIGIAVIICLQQVPAALGVAKPDGENTAAIAWRAALDGLTEANVAAIAVTVLTTAVIVVVPRVHRSLPASLLGVVIAVAFVELASVDVARIGALPGSLPMPSLPSASLSEIRALVSAALAVALLAALESLLSAKVADGMMGRRRHDPDRELFGQGLANLASPLFGGMPATGAIARTAVNVRAGATTRLASIVHALVLLLIVLFGSGIVARIPIAALAGVLIVAGLRMIEVHNVRAVVRSTRADATVFAVTAMATVAFDLVVAVGIGIVAAALLALTAVARSASATVDDDAGGRELLAEGIVSYRIDGALFFGAAQRFLTELTAVADVRVAILRLPMLQVLDATGAQALREIVDELEARGITVLLKGARVEHVRVLEAVSVVEPHHLFATLDDAVAHARAHALPAAATRCST
jgi:SulP family sulfate permease